MAHSVLVVVLLLLLLLLGNYSLALGDAAVTHIWITLKVI